MIEYFDRNSRVSGFEYSSRVGIIGNCTDDGGMFEMDFFDQVGEVGSLTAEKGYNFFNKQVSLSIKSNGVRA